jgi:anti-sigma regulatory factor (Ser/Thr protein kinase)
MTAPGDERAGPVPDLELEFPRKPEFVRLARHAVGALARLHESRDDVVDDIRLAVSEACTTAVGLGGPPSGTGALILRATADRTRMTVELVDPDSTALREVAGPPSDLDTEDLPFERALALPVIRGLVDDLAVTPHQGRGATLRMVISTEGLPQ